MTHTIFSQINSNQRRKQTLMLTLFPYILSTERYLMTGCLCWLWPCVFCPRAAGLEAVGGQWSSSGCYRSSNPTAILRSSLLAVLGLLWCWQLSFYSLVVYMDSVNTVCRICQRSLSCFTFGEVLGYNPPLDSFFKETVHRSLGCTWKPAACYIWKNVLIFRLIFLRLIGMMEWVAE